MGWLEALRAWLAPRPRPAPTGPDHPAALFAAGAVGPEVAQGAHSRAVLGHGVPHQPLGDPVVFHGDVLSPQQFNPGAERFAQTVDASAVDNTTGWPSLPGRLVSPAAWDGEPGAFDPMGERL